MSDLAFCVHQEIATLLWTNGLSW